MTVAVILLSLRYEQAIVLPTDPAAAARLLGLALGLVPVLSLLSAAALGLLIALGGAGYGSLDPIAVPIAFVGLTGFGTVTALRYWYIRQHAYRPVSEVQVIQSVTRSVGQVAAGEIRHKIAAASRFCAFKEFVFPAAWTDGFTEGGIPEGTVIQLDPTLDLDQFELTREERIVLYVLHETQKERGGRDVPTTMLWGRVCEHFWISPEDLSAMLARLGARKA